jgi:predicted transcriptional regulator
MPPLSATPLKLEPELKDRIRKLAESKRRSANFLMREAISEYVEREEARDRAHRDALAAWAAYQADGQHVTAEEADTWLEKLAAGEDAEPPACHD